MSKKKTVQEQRRENASLILNTIRQSGRITRKQLSDKTDLSIPSVTNIVDFLEELKLVSSVSGKGITNKKVPFYHFDSKNYFVIGLALHRTHAGAILTDLSGKISKQFSHKFTHKDNREEIHDAIAEKIKKMINLRKDKSIPVLGLCIGAPGPVNVVQGKILNPKDFSMWEDFEIRDYFQEKLDLPVFLEYNTDMMMFSEKQYGAGMDKSNLLLFYISSGVGCSILYNNKLFRASSIVYHSVGHLTINPEGPLCSCGNSGCLESYISKPILQNRLNKAVSEFEKSKILKEAAYYTSIAIRNIITILAIEDVILGGNVIADYPELFGMIKQEMHNQHFVSNSRPVRIEIGSVKDYTIEKGCAAFMTESILKNMDISYKENDVSLSVDRSLSLYS